MAPDQLIIVIKQRHIELSVPCAILLGWFKLLDCFVSLGLESNSFPAMSLSDDAVIEDRIYGALIERDVWCLVLDMAKDRIQRTEKNIADWRKTDPKKRPSAKVKGKGKVEKTALKNKKEA